MSKNTIEVDSAMIDQSLEELSKLMVRLDKNQKKTRKDQNTIQKIQEIRETISTRCMRLYTCSYNPTHKFSIDIIFKLS